MGVNFAPVFLDDANEIIAFLNPLEFHAGIKIMEQAYDSFLMQAVHSLLSSEYAETKVIWACDIADPWGCDITDPVIRKLPYNLYRLATEHTPWCALHPDEVIIDERCKQQHQNMYLINHDRNTYVDLSKCYNTETMMPITPLPLLTAECAHDSIDPTDYATELHDQQLIGTWSNQTISCSFERPPTEIVVNYAYN